MISVSEPEEDLSTLSARAIIDKILAHIDRLTNKPEDSRLSVWPPLRAMLNKQGTKIQRDVDWGV